MSKHHSNRVDRTTSLNVYVNDLHIVHAFLLHLLDEEKLKFFGGESEVKGDVVDEHSLTVC